MAGESLNLPHNGVILTHSSKGPDLSLWGQSNGKRAYLRRSNVIRLNFSFFFPTEFQSFNDLSLSTGCGSRQYGGLFRDAENSAHSCYPVHLKNAGYWARPCKTMYHHVQLLVAEIKQGRESPEDEPWPVPSQAATTEEKIAEIHQIITES